MVMNDTRQNMATSDVSPSLIAAYNATRYRVFTDEEFDLRIGQSSARLRDLYQNYGCLSAALITAWNPYSAATSEVDNVAAQGRLEGKLSAGSIPFIEAIGEDVEMKWPGEPSVLALGLNLDAAKSLGIEFLQNAIVWAGKNAAPQLVLLR
jgi:hypothetical protein